MNKTIGFIGAGNMGGALAEVVCRKLDPSQILVYNPTMSKVKRLADQYHCGIAASSEEIVHRCEIVVLCVNPPIVNDVIAPLLPIFSANKGQGKKQILVSIVGAWSTEELTKLFQKAGISLPIIRSMPNIPIRIGKGVNLFCRNRYIKNEDMERVMDIFSEGGLCEEVPEDLLPAACPVFSCSPAMAYMFIESLADGGVQIGMDRERATRFAAQAVLGSAAMVLEGSKHIGQLKDELSTPGGMTINGTNEMERLGFRGAAIQGVLKAYERQMEIQNNKK
ncbi:MAG: pyrroline-5-carboxylate reductase [Butyricicoccus sp.]